MRVTTPSESGAESSVPLSFLAALYNRNYRFLWLGHVCASFVMRVDSLVLGWLVLEMTHSAFMVGLIGATRFLGSMIGPWAGVAADRVDRLQLIQATTVILGAIVGTLTLLVVLRRLEVWHLFAATILRGIVQAFLQPAQQSLQADILNARELSNGISLTTMAMNITSITGPLLGGFLLACCRPAHRVWDWSDTEMVLSLNWRTFAPENLYAATSQGRVLISANHGLSWVKASFSLPGPIASMLALEGTATGVQWVYVTMLSLQFVQLISYFLMRPSIQTTRRSQSSIWHNLREGMIHSRQNAGLWTPLYIAGLVNLVSFPLMFNLLPVFARDVYSVGAAGLGWLGAALGVGALIGSLVMVMMGTNERAAKLMIMGSVLWSLCELVFALMPSFYVGLGVLVATGMAQTMCLTNVTIMLLSTSSSDMRGRVMGLRSLAVAPLFLGSLLSGAAAEEYGAPLTTLVCALLGIVGTLIVIPFVPRTTGPPRTESSSGRLSKE